MVAAAGNLGERPYVEIDGVPYPLVRNSQIQRSPLNPFSPSTVGGNSSRITDARLAVQVWDNFTGGLGLRDEEGQDGTSYAEGNLDARVAGAVALPPLPTYLGPTGFTLANAPVYVEYMRANGGSGAGLFVWSPASVRRSTITLPGLSTSSGTDGTVRGFAAFKNKYWFIQKMTASGFMRVVSRLDVGAETQTHITAGVSEWHGLVAHDNRLITWNATTGQFLESLDGATWTTHSTTLALLPGEQVVQLLTWVAPGGNRNTVYAVTTHRIMGYEDESGDWQEFYSYEGVVNTRWPNAHVFRRDGNVYLGPFDDPNATVPDKNGLVLMFNPGVSDEVGPTKRFGLPADYVDGVLRLQGGVHWLYGFCYGNPGAVLAFNEFQGWTSMFDPRTVGAGTARVIGGGYANSRLWVVTSEGFLYEMVASDRRELPPRSDGSTYNTGSHYIRSAWTTNNQKNRWKIGAYFEVDFRDRDGLSNVPAGTEVWLKYRVDNAPWVEIRLGNPPQNEPIGLFLMQSVVQDTAVWPVKVLLPQNTDMSGLPYKRLQWEVRYQRSNPSTNTPVLASVALYHTFWQENKYAYQFNIDLTAEGWGDWPDATFGEYTRDELVEKLLSLNTTRGYSTLTLYSGSMAETIEASDVLIAAREDAELGGGIYSVTMRDLSV